MCGIFLLLNNKDYSEDVIKEQFEKGKGRGPEYSKIQNVGSHAILGFHRLAINGLNPESNQPIQIDNCTLICNGEIYNYKQLYDELGITPQCDSDCEVIIHLYKRFGIEHTLQLVDGVFAFALIDYNIEAEYATTYIARDPFGVRPLYQITSPTGFHGFASELKCLSNFYGKIDHVLPGTYNTFQLSYKVSSEWVLKGLSQRYHIASIITASYSSEEYSEDMYYYKQSIRDSLCHAVEKRCSTTERPIACLLSGGLDSSLITALVANYHRMHSLPILETYSIGLEGSTDLKYARIVADYLGTKHTEVILTESDFLLAIPEVIQAIESYDTTSVRASIGNYLLGKYISKNSNAKVILNGDGSDEVCGGYLYMNKCPDDIEFDKETRRLLKDIHLFDVLRSDKSISSHGLEPRTPFLDKSFVNYYLSISPHVRNHNNTKNIEKYILRNSFSKENFKNFEGKQLLPDEVLWRKKEAFSDGVTSKGRSLYQILQEHISFHLNMQNMESIYNVDHIDETVLVYSPDIESEKYYYKQIFLEFFPNCQTVLPYYWMPKYSNAIDPSARTLDIYNYDSDENNKTLS